MAQLENDNDTMKSDTCSTCTSTSSTTCTNKDLWQKLCMAIVSLNHDCTKSHVHEMLHPYIEAWNKETTNSNNNNNDKKDEASSCLSCCCPRGLSPLMVASDKGNLICLDYLSQYPVAIVGSPVTRSWSPESEHDGDGGTTTSGGNTAVHHAAMAGCAGAWKIFAMMLLRDQHEHHQNEKEKEEEEEEEEEEYHQEKKEKEKEDVLLDSIYPILGSLTNDNHDTPLHMAVVAGQLDFVRQFWMGSSSSSSNSSSSRLMQAKRNVLQRANHPGDTCITLACGHGHLPVLRFLLEQCQVTISHDDMETCQSTVHRMDRILQAHAAAAASSSSSSSSSSVMLLERQAQVHACWKMLQEQRDQQVEQATNELLALNDNNTNNNHHELFLHAVNNNQPQKSKKKQKKKKNRNKNHHHHNNKKTQQEQPPNQESGNSKTESSCDMKQQHEDSFCTVSRLQDGRVAVTVQPRDATAWSEPPATAVAVTSNLVSSTTMSPHKLLRQRLKETCFPPVGVHNNIDQDVDAVMDALCLTVPMLLYTAHGMALNLSPSQLDAVEHILHQQMQAVQTARDLQTRMHHSSSSSTTATHHHDNDNDNDNHHHHNNSNHNNNNDQENSKGTQCRNPSKEITMFSSHKP